MNLRKLLLPAAACLPACVAAAAFCPGSRMPATDGADGADGANGANGADGADEAAGTAAVPDLRNAGMHDAVEPGGFRRRIAGRGADGQPVTFHVQ